MFSFLIVKALTKPNTYFLFRENSNEEVEITIENNKVKAYPRLTKKEKKYIKKYYTKQ